MTFSRVRALIVVAALLITAGTMVIMAISKDSQENQRRADKCPPGLVPTNITMPAKRSEVVLNVFNGTQQAQLAQRTAQELAFRTFTVKKVATVPGNKVYNNIATLVFGPEAYGAAWLTSANFLADDDVKMQFEIDRKGKEVDIILGTEFLQLASPTEVNQTIAVKGKPLLPTGTCEA